MIATAGVIPNLKGDGSIPFTGLFAWVGEFARNGYAMDMEQFVADNPWAFGDVIPVLWEATTAYVDLGLTFFVCVLTAALICFVRTRSGPWPPPST